MDINFRMPTADDGAQLHKLVAASPPLDGNSLYCNLLHCSHFASSGIAAEKDGQLLGFISAYFIPERPKTLFVWQVVVAQSARGQGLGKRMLTTLIERTQPAALETTITADNPASWALFRSFAQSKNATFNDTGVLFGRQQHFANQHDSENLVQIKF